jgi:hypothetical protein
MANEALLNPGAEIILAAAGTTSQLDDDAFAAGTDADRESTDNPGYPLGIFEFDTAAGGWTGAPTAGGAIHLYERKINSDGNQAPAVDATNENDYMWTWNVDIADVQQWFTSPPLPINRSGATYYVKWVDGGAGTVDMVLGWELRLTPVTYGT